MINLFFNLPGGSEIVLILLIVLIFFGGKKIPELMRGLGKGMREFNNARTSIETEIKEGMKDADRKAIEERKEKEKIIEKEAIESKRENT
jgi:sec-independent protein translocase protein TatA